MKRRSRRLLFRACVMSATAMFLFPAHAQAQDEPVVIGARRKLPRVGFDAVHGSLDFYGSWSQDESNSKDDDNDQKTTETRFEEKITLKTQGYYIHPNFFNLSLQGEFGLTQEDFEDNNQSEQTNSMLYLWNVQAEILRENNTSFIVYTDRTENIVDRAFAESFRNIYTTYGAGMNVRYKNSLNTVRIYRTEQEQKSLGGDTNDFTLTDNVLELHSESKPTINQYLVLDYRLNQTDQDNNAGASDSSVGNSASVSHTYAFGTGQRHTLGSTLIYSNTTGDFALTRLRWNELLRMQHTENFKTEYEYLLDMQSSDTVDQTLQRGTAEFWHYLYESLVTHGEIGALSLDTGDRGGAQSYFGNLDLQYTKKVPKGRLEGILDLGYEYRTIESTSEAVSVVDQTYRFVNYQPALIRGQTVNPDSIVITDPTGRIFINGIDYIVTERPDGVRIDPIVGGAMAQDQTVLIDYTVDPIPDADISTANFGISLRYDITEGPLKGLSPYVRYVMIEQSVSGGGGELEPDSVRDYVAGAEYRIWSLTLIGEYEIYDSTLVPFDALRLTARLNHRFSYETTALANLTYVATNYTDLGEDNTTLNANASITHLLNRQLRATAAVDYVQIEDSRSGSTQGLQESVELRWRNRQFEVYGRFRNSNLDTDDEETSFQLLEMGITREF